jgi:hypothetical protein
LEWLRHVVRMDGKRTLIKLLEANHEERRRKRRYRIRWLDDVEST